VPDDELGQQQLRAKPGSFLQTECLAVVRGASPGLAGLLVVPRQSDVRACGLNLVVGVVGEYPCEERYAGSASLLFIGFEERQRLDAKVLRARCSARSGELRLEVLLNRFAPVLGTEPVVGAHAVIVTAVRGLAPVSAYSRGPALVKTDP
jgi:hypothetical protein